MATVLDTSILGNLSLVFVFLILFAGGWGLLRLINPFRIKDEKMSLYALLAFALAFIVMLSPSVINIITFSIPWFTVIMMVAFFMLLFAQMFSTDYDFKVL